MSARWRFVLVATAVVAASVALAEALTGGAARSHHPHHRAVAAQRRRTVPVIHRMLLGRSLAGRPIRAVEIGDPQLPTSLLVVGCVHGNEPAGIRVARALEAHPPAARVWVIDDLNPDGVAADTRQNAQGIDLNRNFPWRWRPLSHASGQYSGPRPLYAPEARIAERFILRVRPRVTVWFHQPLAVVDQSGGDLAVERRFARLAGMREARLTRYPGSAVGWQNHVLPATTAFVVELPPGPVRHAERLVGALRAIAAG